MKELTKKQMIIGFILLIIVLGIAGTVDCNDAKESEKDWKESIK